MIFRLVALFCQICSILALQCYIGEESAGKGLRQRVVECKNKQMCYVMLAFKANKGRLLGTRTFGCVVAAKNPAAKEVMCQDKKDV